MRWGIPEQASNNHSTTDLCLQEIRKCQEVSVGPNFLVRTPPSSLRCERTLRACVWQQKTCLRSIECADLKIVNYNRTRLGMCFSQLKLELLTQLPTSID